MELLGGYASGEDTGDEQQEVTAPRSAAPIPAETRKQGTIRAEDNDVPSSSGASWSKIPAPKVSAAAVKRVIQYQLPIQRAALAADSDDEEDGRLAKRAKPSGGKSKLLDFLPKPKNDAGSALGGGTDGGGRRAMGNKAAVPRDFFAESAAEKAEAAAVPVSNEAYRATYDEQPAATGAAEQYYAADQYAASGSGEYQHHAHDHGQYQQQYQQYGNAPHMEYGAARPPTGSSAGAMQQALKAQQKAAAPSPIDLAMQAELANVQFKEINQSNLTYVDPARKEAQGGVRAALGTDFAVELRSQAASYEGNKLAKRKHQIGTLFFNAKMRELEMMEQRVQGAKSKKETQAKYGW